MTKHLYADEPVKPNRPAALMYLDQPTSDYVILLDAAENQSCLHYGCLVAVAISDYSKTRAWIWMKCCVNHFLSYCSVLCCSCFSTEHTS